MEVEWPETHVTTRPTNLSRRLPGKKRSENFADSVRNSPQVVKFEDLFGWAAVRRALILRWSGLMYRFRHGLFL